LSATNVHSVKHRAIARLKKAVDSRIDKPGEEKSVARK
jgi:hypothetical protein